MSRENSKKFCINKICGILLTIGYQEFEYTFNRKSALSTKAGSFFQLHQLIYYKIAIKS